MIADSIKQPRIAGEGNLVYRRGEKNGKQN
jgi:hypothetical protein